MAWTSAERQRKFAIQMAEQSKKVGSRLRELREERDWKQKDVVAAMEKRGDLSLNTNQLSRYENGGAFPGETRLRLFAEVFDTDVPDLMAGPMASRKPKAAPGDDNGGADRLSRVEGELSRLRELLEGALPELREPKHGRR